MANMVFDRAAQDDEGIRHMGVSLDSIFQRIADVFNVTEDDVLIELRAGSRAHVVVFTHPGNGGPAQRHAVGHNVMSIPDWLDGVESGIQWLSG